MSALSELLLARTELSNPQVAHLQRLVGEWQLISDLSFADLLLWVPVALPDGEAGSVPAFLCVAQCRPTTGPTAYQHDPVGVVQHGARATGLRTAFREQRIFRQAEPDWDGDLPIRREAVPVRCGDGEIIAVLGKDANLASVRTPSQLELVYLQTAADLAAMVADATFPAHVEGSEEGAGPRVGDGLVRLGPDGTVIYASPNAQSAFTRLGLSGSVQSEPIDLLAGDIADDPFAVTDLNDAVNAAISGGQPATVEIEGRGAIALFRALPLCPRGEALGALLLMQDVTELRRRDRQIMSKDATIREIHHRVKNNLQTVAALLRLQSRRLVVPEARAALEESMQRVNSIALVHETLSTSVDEEVDFDAIVDRLLGMLADVTGAAARVTLCRSGTFGEVPAGAATPLVLVLTELVHNAVEHGFPDGASGSVTVHASHTRGRLEVRVADTGVGLPDGFADTTSARLGLQIVRTLLSADLHGELELRAGDDGGAIAVLGLQLAGGTH